MGGMSDIHALRNKAATLRQQADELDKLADAVANALGTATSQGRLVASPAPLTVAKPQTVQKIAPPDGEPTKTQRTCITNFLQSAGPQTRLQIFARLQEEGKAPPDANQLSVVLNRGAKKGWLVRTPDGLWDLPHDFA